MQQLHVARPALEGAYDCPTALRHHHVPIETQLGGTPRIDNCLAQDFTAFEVVMVDDGSQDGTARAVAQHPDARVRLILHRTNQGMWPARNTAVRASRGEWLIFLDRDDEIPPGSLSRVHQHLVDAVDAVDRLGFRYLYGNGLASPMPPEQDLGYAEWLRWIERSPLTGRFNPALSWGLDLAEQLRARMVPVKVAVIHSDCRDRLSYEFSSRDPLAVKRKARDRAAEGQYVLAQHGAALRELASRQYRNVLRDLALPNLLAGKRWSAIQATLAGLWSRPWPLYAWVTLALVLAGPWAVFHLNRIRAERRLQARERPAVGRDTGGSFRSAVSQWAVCQGEY